MYQCFSHKGFGVKGLGLRFRVYLGYVVIVRGIFWGIFGVPLVSIWCSFARLQECTQLMEVVLGGKYNIGDDGVRRKV